LKRSLALIAGVMVVVFGPNILTSTTEAIGAEGSDALKHVWSQWFVHDQLLNRGGLSLHTPLLNAPTGGAFFSLDTVNALIGLPLRIFFDPVTTYNWVLMAAVVAAAVGGAALTRTLTHDTFATALGGLGFALSAWVLCFPLASGVSETAVFWPLPLILLFARKTWSDPGWMSPIVCGGLLTLQGLACWSHGITAGLLLLGLTAAALSVDRSALGDRDRLKRLAGMGTMAVLTALPLYLAVSGTVSADDAVKARNLSLFHSAPIGPLAVPEANSMALLDFVLPGGLGRRVNTVGTERLMYAAYPGCVLLGLGLLALRRRQPHARLLAIGVLLMAMMSMGPRIYLDHARSIGGMPNPIYLLAYWAVPLVNATIHSVDRFAVGLQLCLALLAALGLASLTARWRPWLLAAMVAELLWISPGPWPIPSTAVTAHPAATHIAQHPTPGAVIDLPFIKQGPGGQWFDGDIFMQQTNHGHPIPFQLEGHGIETVSGPVRDNPFFRRIANALVYGHPAPRDCTGAAELSTIGMSWVVWRPELQHVESHQAVDQVLRSCLGTPISLGDRWVFALAN
jgi:hypothetical protein